MPERRCKAGFGFNLWREAASHSFYSQSHFTDGASLFQRDIPTFIGIRNYIYVIIRALKTVGYGILL